MDNRLKIERFWQAYIDSLEPARVCPTHYEAWGFGVGVEMANELSALVVDGVKTATCSLLWMYEAEDEPLPAVGDQSVILDGAGTPRCIIETTEVTLCPYNQVNTQFAHDEGEGDRSLAAWRRAHWHYFGRECAQIGRAVAEDMPLVCERFRVVYR